MEAAALSEGMHSKFGGRAAARELQRSLYEELRSGNRMVHGGRVSVY
jgi:hypothetical protein